MRKTVFLFLLSLFILASCCLEPNPRSNADNYIDVHNGCICPIHLNVRQKGQPCDGIYTAADFTGLTVTTQKDTEYVIAYRITGEENEILYSGEFEAVTTTRRTSIFFRWQDDGLAYEIRHD